MTVARGRARLKRPARAVGIQLILLVLAIYLGVPSLHGQSQDSQSQAQTPANPQSNQDIPDAPSTVQPPAPKLPAATPSNPQPNEGTEPLPGARPPAKQPQPFAEPAPPKMPPVETVPEGSVPVRTSKGTPRNQINPAENLYKLHVTTNFVQIPVMVKDSEGQLVDGLLPRDFTVLENGKPQPLTYFTSDPFQLSVAILIDLGMSDVAVQNVNQTYASLIGAFSPYDEVSVYIQTTCAVYSKVSREGQRSLPSLDPRSPYFLAGHNFCSFGSQNLHGVFPVLVNGGQLLRCIARRHGVHGRAE